MKNFKFTLISYEQAMYIHLKLHLLSKPLVLSNTMLRMLIVNHHRELWSHIKNQSLYPKR